MRRDGTRTGALVRNSGAPVVRNGETSKVGDSMVETASIALTVVTAQLVVAPMQAENVGRQRRELNGVAFASGIS